MPSPYTILRTLQPDQSWLATGPDGRKVVLKVLPDDCQIGQKLHPNIAERLQKLREIPLIHYAHLIAVERIDERVMMVMQYLEGTPITQVSSLDPRRLLRELSIAVQAMHQFGIVHGQIHPNNVLVDAQGNVQLLDASPYLFEDAQVDFDSIEQIAEQLGIQDEQSIDEQETVKREAEDKRFQWNNTVVAAALFLGAFLLMIALAWWLSR